MAANTQYTEPVYPNQVMTRQDLESELEASQARTQSQIGSLGGMYGNINAAARAASGAQRAGVAAQRGKLGYDLKSGLRDISIQRREGLQGAVSNALQRGIYNSGIRKEEQVRVEEGAANAEDDLRAAVKFGLQGLQAQMAGIAAQLQQTMASNALGYANQSFALSSANSDFITQLMLQYGGMLPNEPAAPVANTGGGTAAGGSMVR